MSRALICGSMAYDNIMVFEDEFANHILPDQIHKLNISFMVPTLTRVFGGVAGNIAYNLKMIGGTPVPMGTVGSDFGTYEQRLKGLGITLEAIKVKEGHFTPQAYITTDLKNNQITAFHPGAMNFSHENRVSDYTDIAIGIVGPDGRDGMIQHAQEFFDAGIPFIFDPGQAMPLFNGDDLRQFIEQATWMAVNDYEFELVRKRTGMEAEEVADQMDALFITRGGNGSMIYTENTMYHIPVVKADQVIDPTGCGDAYRAGLLYGLMNGLDYQTTGRIASLLGSIKITTAGTQNHYISKADFRQRFVDEFAYSFE